MWFPFGLWKKKSSGNVLGMFRIEVPLDQTAERGDKVCVEVSAHHFVNNLFFLPPKRHIKQSGGLHRPSERYGEGEDDGQERKENRGNVYEVIWNEELHRTFGRT